MIPSILIDLVIVDNYSLLLTSGIAQFLCSNKTSMVSSLTFLHRYNSYFPQIN